MVWIPNYIDDMRNTLGYVIGQEGRFERIPFYRLRLSLTQCDALDELLARAGAEQRHTTTLTASFHQPDRIRVTEIEAPDYELRAAPQYVRGDIVRVQGKEGVSCGLDISARFGIPLIREQLGAARTRARQYVELRVPSRKRDVVEFVPDVDLNPSEQDVIVTGSVLAAMSSLPPEDFGDWT